jgi:hypothetical protein
VRRLLALAPAICFRACLALPLKVLRRVRVFLGPDGEVRVITPDDLADLVSRRLARHGGDSHASARAGKDEICRAAAARMACLRHGFRTADRTARCRAMRILPDYMRGPDSPAACRLYGPLDRSGYRAREQRRESSVILASKWLHSPVWINLWRGRAN